LAQQRVEAGDMIDVRVRQQDCAHPGVAGADELDHRLGLEIRVDDDRIMRVAVLDEVRVRAELGIGGRLDLELQDASRATVWTSRTPSIFSMRRDSCASESISTVADTDAVLSSCTLTSSADMLTWFSATTVAMSRSR